MLGIFLDTETNGLNAKKHRVLEIAYKVIDLYSGAFEESFHAVLSLSPETWELSDLESLKVNGFTWEEISQGRPSSQVANQIIESFQRLKVKRGEAVFICQNPSFDRAFFAQLVDPDRQEALQWPYHWLDLASMYWAEGMRRGKENPAHYPWKTGLSKDRIAKAYNLASEEKPHRAMNGVNHLILCYEAVIGFPHKTQNA